MDMGKGTWLKRTFRSIDHAPVHELRELVQILGESILQEWEGDEATRVLRNDYCIGELRLKSILYGRAKSDI